MRLEENIPDLVFRWTWECFFTGWIDEAPFICYNDMGLLLFHLEINQIERIKKYEDDYDFYGCHYEIKGDQLVATCPAIVGSQTQTMEEAKALYRAFKEKLPLEVEADYEEKIKTEEGVIPWEGGM